MCYSSYCNTAYAMAQAPLGAPASSHPRRFSMPDSSFHITHDPDASRFELAVDGHTAHLDYMQTAINLVISHTEVPVQVEGQGVGSALVEAVLAHAKAADLPVIPMCPFARAYIANRRRKAPRA